MKHYLNILLTFAILLTITACGGGQDKTGPDRAADVESPSDSTTDKDTESDGDESMQLTLPIANGDVELLIYMGMENNARQVYQSYAEHPVVKQMMGETGLKLLFMHPPQGDDGTFFNTIIASGEYPDIFHNDFGGYPGGPDGAIEDGILIKMNELIYKYAPTYVAMVESMGEEIARKTRSDQGNIIRFGTMFTAPILEGKANRGLITRKDWLKELGMETPQTIEEYEAFMKAMKEELNVEVPLAMCETNHWLWTTGHYFSAAFGVTQSGFYLNEGQVKYSPIEPGYNQYMELLNKWYKEGYIDQDFPNRTAEDSQRLFINGRAGIIMTGNWLIQQVITLGQIEYPDFDLAPLYQPVVNKGDKIDKVWIEESVDDRTWLVTTSCKNPVEAVKFIEYLHQPETMTLTAWGPGTDEYPTYVEVDGKKRFTDFMVNNPDAHFQAMRERYTANYFQVMWEQEMEEQQYSHPANIEAWEKWSENADNTGLLPIGIMLTADESRDLSRIMNQIETYTGEMFYKFVLDLEPLDKFDEFVTKIEELGVDNAIQIMQTAYERYLNR